MKQNNVSRQTIGRVENVAFPEIGIDALPARIDTGAQTSAIWVSRAKVVNERLEVIFFGPGYPQYTGDVYYFDEFTHGMVASSNGQAEARYKIRTLVVMGGKKIRARLTLADRSTQTYPVLVGRNILRGKFIVDVKLGSPDIRLEKAQSAAIQAKLEKGE